MMSVVLRRLLFFTLCLDFSFISARLRAKKSDTRKCHGYRTASGAFLKDYDQCPGGTIMARNTEKCTKLPENLANKGFVQKSVDPPYGEVTG